MVSTVLTWLNCVPSKAARVREATLTIAKNIVRKPFGMTFGSRPAVMAVAA